MMASPLEAISNNSSSTTHPSFTVGQLVHVQARTWPGINQPGGVGRVTGATPHYVSVRYILDGRHEKEIPTKYVRPHNPTSRRSLRDRSMLLGRCKNCGSLRKDCGSCDVIIHQPEWNDNESSSSDDSLKEILQEIDGRFARHMKLKARASRLQTEMRTEGSYSEMKEKDRANNDKLDSSDDDDSILQELTQDVESQAVVRWKRQRLQRWAISSANERRQRRRAKIQKRTERNVAASQSALANVASQEMDSPNTVASKTSSPLSFASPDIDDEGGEESERVAATPLDTRAEIEADTSMADDDQEVVAFEEGDEFIQPEGDADELPDDIRDQARHVPYGELANFFDQIVSQLEDDKIPNARSRLMNLERQWKDASSPERKKELLKESQNLHDHFIQSLVRSCLDQCQSALRRLSDRKLYKEHLTTLSSHQREQCRRSNRDAREFQFDALSDAAEEIMAKTRELVRTIENTVEDDILSNDEGSSEGWVDPEDSSPIQAPLEESPLNNMTLAELATFDPHMYAMRKSKQTTGVHDGQRNERQSARKRPRKSSKRTVAVDVAAPRNRKTRRQESSAGQRRPRAETESESDADSRAVEVGTAELQSPDALDEGGKALQRFLDGSAPVGTLRESRTRRGPSGPTGNEAIERMERFLDANTSSGLDVGPPEAEHDSWDRRKSQRRRRRLAPRQAVDRVLCESLERPSEGGSSRRSESAPCSMRQEQQGICRREMFSLLEANSSQSSRHQQISLADGESVQSLCRFLIDQYPSPACQAVLDKVECVLLQSDTTASDCAPLVFRTLTEILQKRGSMILGDLVSREDPSLTIHVKVLAVLMRMIKLRLHEKLASDDGPAFKIFSADAPTALVDFLVLQIVDSAFSLVHPSAWALNVKDRRKALRSLDPLREALSEHCHVIERVCFCVTEELEVQQWRCVRNGEHAFVSCVDPIQWSDFLESGKSPPKRKALRYAALGRQFALNEIDALWCLLAYFASSHSQAEKDGRSCWSLLSDIFTRGVLIGSDSQSESLPPNQSQLNACARDLRNLTSLLSVGAMNGLGQPDSFMASLIRKSLLLQAEDLYYNEDSRLAFYPTVRNEDADKSWLSKLLASLRSDTISVIGVDYSIGDLPKAMNNSEIVCCFMGQPLLLPSYPILRCCLALLSAWIQRVPPKKPRRKRLYNVISTLAKDLIAEASRCRPKSELVNEGRRIESGESNGDRFLEAFSSVAPAKSGLGTKRWESFLRESVAYLLIVSAMTRGSHSIASNLDTILRPEDPSALTIRVWDFLADDGMKQRQKAIASLGHTISSENFQGDAFRCLVSAKSLTFLLMTALGVAPQNTELLSSEFTMTRFFADENNEECIFFLLTCLMSCLDCACDVRDCTEIMSFICSCLCVSLLHIKGRLSDSLPVDLRRLDASELRLDRFLQMILPIFGRAFQILTSKSYCGPEEETCFKSLVSFVREAIALNAKFKVSTENAETFKDGSDNAESETRQSIETTDDSDFFGGLDDAVFAGIDLGDSAPGEQSGPENTSRMAVCQLLVESVEKAKPSERFAIVPVASADEMSTQGKMLVKRQCDSLCRCSVALASLDWSSSSQASLLARLFAVQDRFVSKADGRDLAYFKNVAYAATSELCYLSSSMPQALDIARAYRQDLLCNAVEAVLDADVLKKLPSSNLSSKASDEFQSAAKEDLLYTKFQEGALTSLRNAVDDIWRFCGSFGRLFDKFGNDYEDGDSRLGTWFVGFDHDLPSELPLRLRPSLEKEILDRFRMLRGIISNSVHGGPSLGFDILTSLMVASTSNQLLSLSQAVAKSRAHGDAAGDNYEHIKCLEVFAAYSELHVATLAWILREGDQTLSRDQTTLRRHLFDHYLPLFLQNQTPDMKRPLCQLVRVAASGVSGGSVNTQAVSGPPSKATFAGDEYIEAIIRRSREFMIYIAQEHAKGTEMLSSGFFRSLLTFGTQKDDKIAWTIARSFCSTAYSVSSAEYMDNGPSTQRAINQYIAFVEKHRPLTKEEAKALIELKQFALETVLVPRLGMERLGRKERTGILRLLRHMLDMEQHETTNIGAEPRMNANVLSLLARGICTSIRAALVASAVDEDLVSVSYLVARSLMHLPATCVDGDAVGWLADWCSSFACGSAYENSSKAMQASYLWYFSRWLKELGEMIVDRTEVGTIQKYRDSLRSKHSSGDKVSWPLLDKRGSDPAQAMTRLEKKFFSEKENSLNVVNVYAKEKQISESAEAKDWIPGDSIRSVRRYLVDAKRAG